MAKFLVLVKANEQTEAGELPSEKLVAEMTRFNEELVKHRIMVSGEGLHPSAKGARVRFSGKTGGNSVVDGPFAETKELVAGFWIWECASLKDAIAWARKIPNPAGEGPDSEVEIRQIFDAEEFGKNYSPELRAQEEHLREVIASQRS